MTDKPKRRYLTDRQEHILRELVLFTYKNRRQPSYAELAEILGVSTVERQIAEIEAKGWIHRTGQTRAIEIPQDVWDAIVPAGVEVV